MAAYEASEYTYRVFWSEADEAFMAAVAEMPDITFCESSQPGALAGIVDKVALHLEQLDEAGKEAPVPFGKRVYSGRYSLRMSPEQHRRVAIEAAELGVSINQLLVSRI